MTQESFEKLTGIKLTAEQFEKMNEAYQMTPYGTENHFCAMLLENPNDVVMEAGHLAVIYRDAFVSKSNKFDLFAEAVFAYAREKDDKELFEIAKKHTKPSFAILWKIEKGITLDKEEITYIKARL